MKNINLTANDKEQELILAYLKANASATLAEKINNGVTIEKDGKRLINKKTLDGFMKYACDEARKSAEKGKTAAFVSDDVVYGWAIHYFEEDSIEGTLYNEDGTEYKPVKSVTQIPAPSVSYSSSKPKPEPQMSLFDLMNAENAQPVAPTQEITATEQPAVPAAETQKEEPKPLPTSEYDEEPSEEEKQEILAEIAEEEHPETPPGSPLYQKYMAIRNKYPDSIVAYRLGDFYEVFGDNAVTVAKELDLTLTGRDCGLNERVPMVGFPFHSADVYFKKIISKGYTLIVCENQNEVRRLPIQTPIDYETGEVLDKDIEELSEREMRQFDGDIHEPDEQDDEPSPYSSASFDKETMVYLYDVLDGKLDIA